MAHCRYIEICTYFSEQIEKVQTANVAVRPGDKEGLRRLASTYQLKYCMHQCRHCARHIVADVLGVDRVPEDLTPDEVIRARSIIERHQQPEEAAPAQKPKAEPTPAPQGEPVPETAVAVEEKPAERPLPRIEHIRQMALARANSVRPPEKK